MPKVTLDWFKKYIEPAQPDRPIHHPFYKQTVKKYERIKTHSDGLVPKKLISERRPSESPEIQEYREKIYVEKTQAAFTKVYSSLMKIRKSPDWNIKEGEILPVVPKAETLYNYLMMDWPKYTSITNWYFQIGLKQQLIDTNAKTLVMPLNIGAKDNEYLKPYPFIFNSNDVIDYRYGEYYVLHSPEKITFVENNQTYQGEKYYVVTDTAIQIFEQYTMDNRYKQTMDWAHGLKYIPVFDFKGVVMDETYWQCLYDSKIQGMIPCLDEAAREYSDMQAEVVQHIHSVMWAYQPTDCTACGGAGKIPTKKQDIVVNVECKKCRGSGKFPFSPYTNLVIGKGNPGDSPAPIPPAGYITKDTAIVKIQDERVANHIFSAYASINMEFLAATPLNQSGTAKEVDKEELNNFVHGVAEDGVEYLDNIVRCTADYRHGTIDKQKRKKLLPTINVPEKFDLLGDKYLLDGIEKMKTAKVDASIINAAEIEYAGKRFASDQAVKDIVSLKLSLDPFAGASAQDLGDLRLAGLITDIDAILHAYIHPFVERAMIEVPKFKEMEKAEQLAVLEKYAQEKLAEIKADKQAQEPVDGDGEPEQEGEDGAAGQATEGGGEVADRLGKVPLAVQQISLAITRLQDAGFNDSANKLKKKLDEITKEIDMTT